MLKELGPRMEAAGLSTKTLIDWRSGSHCGGRCGIPLGSDVGVHFKGAGAVAEMGDFQQIHAEKFFDGAETLVLRDVAEFVSEEVFVRRMIRAEEDPVTQGEGTGFVGQNSRLAGEHCEIRVLGVRNFADLRDADRGGATDVHRAGDLRLVLGQFATGALDGAFHLLGPLHREGEEAG